MPTRKKTAPKKKKPVGNVTIVVKRKKITIEASKVTKDACIDIARAHGVGKFNLYIDGSKVKNEKNFPKKIAAGSLIEIKPYDEWG